MIPSVPFTSYSHSLYASVESDAFIPIVVGIAVGVGVAIAAAGGGC